LPVLSTFQVSTGIPFIHRKRRVDLLRRPMAYQDSFKALLVAVRLRPAVDWGDAFFATGREG
jgi:hypothetical protein